MGDPEEYLIATHPGGHTLSRWGSPLMDVPPPKRNNLQDMGQVLFFLLFRQWPSDNLATCAQRFPPDETWRYWKSLVIVLLGTNPTDQVDPGHLQSHPLFWVADPRRSYTFLARTVTSFGATLNQLCDTVPLQDWLGSAEGWKSRLPTEMVHVVRDYKNYKDTSVADLFRVILLTVREIESPSKNNQPPNPHVEALRQSVFPDVHHIVHYFQCLFPNLTALLWEVLFYRYMLIQHHDHNLSSLLFSSPSSMSGGLLPLSSS